MYTNTHSTNFKAPSLGSAIPPSLQFRGLPIRVNEHSSTRRERKAPLHVNSISSTHSIPFFDCSAADNTDLTLLGPCPSGTVLLSCIESAADGDIASTDVARGCWVIAQGIPDPQPAITAAPFSHRQGYIRDASQKLPRGSEAPYSSADQRSALQIPPSSPQQLGWFLHKNPWASTTYCLQASRPRVLVLNALLSMLPKISRPLSLPLHTTAIRKQRGANFITHGLFRCSSSSPPVATTQ